MKSLSVKPKWAALIRSRTKSIETRTWQTPYRGPLLICATRPEGAASCIVDLLESRPMTAADWPAACCDPYPDACAWVLGEVIPLPPFSVRGQLRLFEVSLPQEALQILRHHPGDLARRTRNLL